MWSQASHAASIDTHDYSSTTPAAVSAELDASQAEPFLPNESGDSLPNSAAPQFDGDGEEQTAAENDDATADFVNDHHERSATRNTTTTTKRKRPNLDVDSYSDDDSDFDIRPSKSAKSKKSKTSSRGAAATKNSSSRSKNGVNVVVKKEKVSSVKKEKVEPGSPRRKQMSTATAHSKSKAAAGSSSTKVKKEPTTQKEKAKKAEEVEVWRWWEEEKSTDGRKWTTLCHNGPVFADSYKPLPADVKFYYDGQEMVLSEPAEEVMTFYAKMLNHDYTKKDLFNENFMRDWRKYMTNTERKTISSLAKCDFTHVNAYFEKRAEERKNMPKEEKKKIKEANDKIRQKYGYCFWDNHRQPVGNYKIEPPGLFRGRGEHPKQGCVKKRILPEDVIINCDKRTKPPEPPEGHRWKEVRHDNRVSWLATWTENVMGNNKYIMLNPSARVKAERDWQKYEKARKLHRIIDQIRTQYQAEWRSREMRIRQRAVALYFIDKLALRVGNEKEDDEADTVGCCSLRFEHIKLHEHLDGIGDNVVEFDFPGKDSIRYHNCVPVELRVFKNLRLFLENKTDGDDLFDRVTTTSLNQYLTDLMEGLTAKVFRTYNASRTLQEQLDKLTNPADSVAAKLLSYNRANREVAILCNHQRSIPKTFDVSMEKLRAKVDAKKMQVKELKKECKNKETDYKNTHSIQAKKEWDKRKTALERAKEQLMKLQIQATDKEENKQIALSTSKLNYLDPRITVAWCKKNNVPIEKIYSKTQRDKFLWAMHMADENFHFHDYQGEIQLKEESSSQTEDANESNDAADQESEEDEATNR